MKIFIIHRFSDNHKLVKTIKELKSLMRFHVSFITLDSSKGESWKSRALKKLKVAELVLIYNPDSCNESDNAKWEIEKSTSLGKPTLNISDSMPSSEIASLIQKHFDFKEEFEACFTEDCSNTLELYKIMIDSSEALVQRRQKTNAFFITIIGSLLAIGGLLHKVGVLTADSAELVALFCVVALLLCNSWRNLLDNFGKLNTAKFKVISRLELMLGEQVFNAEWIALGKGKQPEKYRSFTETEKNVPLYIAILFFLLTITASILRIMG